MMATLASALASACGGQSFTGTGGDAGSSSTAGNGQGGSSSHAGTGSAGKAQAGGATGGGSSAGTGSTSAGTGSTSSSGGTPNEACAAPPNSGMCDAYFPAWYHDPSTGICRPFVYGGCGGNANRYGSLAECQKACPVSNPNFDSCKVPTDCVVTGTGCCGICDGAGITEHDLIAYNRQYTNVFECGFALDIAGGGTGSAGAAAPIACAPCPLPPAGEGTLKYFVPNCIAGQCVVEDLRKSPVTACKTSNECKVRNGTGCCEGCNGGDPVAVRNDGSFEKLVCSPSSVCAGCLPEPSSAVPYCGQDGHCQAVFREDAGG
jgi:hypothetical protein